MNELWFICLPIAAVLALLFAVYKAVVVLKVSKGNDKMIKIAGAIKKGAGAYLKRQYKTVIVFFAVVFVILLGLTFVKTPDGATVVGIFTPFAFITGGVFSALSGFFGMKIATEANTRTANSAKESLNKGLKVAFSAGTVMGFVVVGLALIDISIWFSILKRKNIS